MRGNLLPGLEPLGAPRELRGATFPFHFNNCGEFQNVGEKDEEIGRLQYKDGRHAALRTFAHIASGNMFFYSEKGCQEVGGPDAFFRFKNMPSHFLEYLRAGHAPFDWHETVATIQVVVAGEKSLNAGGRAVKLDETEFLRASGVALLQS